MPKLEDLIRQHTAEKHALNLHVVVSYIGKGAEVEGFHDRSAAVARAAEPGARRTFIPLLTPVQKHVEFLGHQVDSEFAPLL